MTLCCFTPRVIRMSCIYEVFFVQVSCGRSMVDCVHVDVEHVHNDSAVGSAECV